MHLAVLGIVFELVFEILIHVLAAVVGLAIAELIYASWVAVRWLMSPDRGAQQTCEPNGAVWSVRCTWRPIPSSWPLSGRLFGARRRRPGEPNRSEQHWLHPARMADRFDDFFLFLAPVFIALLVVAVAVFIVETIVVVLLVSMVSAWRFLVRRSWRVEITEPDGNRTSRAGLTFNEATTLAGRVKADITSGRPVDSTLMSRVLP